jgi:menaquinone reductase, multiheme cytochrome c subunit
MSSAQEHKGNVVAEGEATAHHHAEEPGNWSFLTPIVTFGAGFVVMLFVGWIVFPEILYSEKQQPIDFNHALHVESAGEGCESCHYFREDGSFSGVPRLENCLQCHEQQMGENPEEAKLVKEYVEQQKEIPWLIYSRQPDCVYFSHAAHVKIAEMECVTCHGPIGESKHTEPYEYNILTTYSRDIWGKNIAGLTKNSWDRMKMDDCAACHEEKGASNACFACHQ